MSKKHKALHGHLYVGTTVIDFRGLRWTRIARRGQADWIADNGTLSQHLPFSEAVLTVENMPYTGGNKIAFKATPVLGPSDVGFGIVRESDVKPGDVIFDSAFNFVQLKNIVSVERKNVRKRGVVREVTVATNKNGTEHILSEANYVARGLGNDINSYVA